MSVLFLLESTSQSPAASSALQAASGSASDSEAKEHSRLVGSEMSGIADVADGSVGVVVSVVSLPHSLPFMGHVMRVLKKPGGRLVLVHPPAVDVKKSAVFAGFADVATQQQEQQLGGLVMTKASVPSWSMGDSAPLKLNLGGVDDQKQQQQQQQQTQNDNNNNNNNNNKSNVWSFAADDLNDDGVVELEDEDALLEQEEEQVAVYQPPSGDLDDCGESGKPTRKACKNCSCGRAEQEASGAITLDDVASQPAKISACGSCGLGDAFRCSTCPFLGKPAFKSDGDVVKLAL